LLIFRSLTLFFLAKKTRMNRVPWQILLQLGIAENFVVGRRIRGQAEPFASPGAEVYVFAALATKRAKPVTGTVDALTATARAYNQFDGGGFFFHRRHVSDKV
jgi:hypothetical protein